MDIEKRFEKLEKIQNNITTNELRQEDIIFNFLRRKPLNKDEVQMSLENMSEVQFQKYSELSFEIRKDLEELKEVKKELKGYLNILTNHKEISVLTLRYFDLKEYHEIVDFLKISLSSVYKSRKKGIDKIEAEILKSKKNQEDKS